MTEHEAEARKGFAELSRRPENQWAIVYKPEPGVWYDFFDPATRRYGQCRMGLDGRWSQEPRGEQPVVLRHLPTRRARLAAEKAKGADHA